MRLGKALATGFAEDVEPGTEVIPGLALGPGLKPAPEEAAPDTATVAGAYEEPVAELR